MSREQSPDESGYYTHIPRRNSPPSEEYDPSEHDDSDPGNIPEKSVTPSPDLSPQSTLRRRTRATARMSVRPPIRETFTIPCRDEAGPSRLRERRVSPPPVAEIPAPPSAGMTSSEFRWVADMSRNIQHFRLLLNYHDKAIDTLQKSSNSSDGILGEIISMVGEGNQLIEGILGELAESREVVARLRSCLSLVVAFLVVLVAWMTMGVRR